MRDFVFFAVLGALLLQQGNSEIVGEYPPLASDRCGGDISGGAGMFRSRNYPYDYEPNQDCTWRITVPESYRVHIAFRRFRLEDSASCTSDFVEIRQGHSPDGDLLGRFCGNTKPVLPISASNKISVRFVSDSSNQEQGFVAQFEKDTLLAGSPYTCNRYITAESGNISSPMFPSYYPKNSDCTWRISVPDAETVILKFNVFYLESSTSACVDDSVKVFDGHLNLNLIPLGTFCGTRIPETIHSTTNKITVVFVSDNVNEKTGFSAEFFGGFKSEEEEVED